MYELFLLLNELYDYNNVLIELYFGVGGIEL